MSSNIETTGNNEVPMSEVAQLTRRIESLGIDPTETEAVLKEAVLMFGEGRPEHEVEKIITDFYQAIADKITIAEEEADRLAA